MIERRFESALEARNKLMRTQAEADKRILEISSNGDGTPLEDYLSPEDAELCIDFIRVASDRGVLGKPLALEKTDHILTDDELRHGSRSIEARYTSKRKLSIFGLHPGFTRSVNTPLSKFEKADEYKKWKQVWSGNGFRIGKLALPTSNYSGYTDVFLCTDARLRCERNWAFKGLTRAHGVGTIPPGSRLEIGTISSDYESGYESINHAPLQEVLLKVLNQ